MNSRFNIIDTPLQGLMLIQREPMQDTRGYLERLYCAQELELLVQVLQEQQRLVTVCVVPIFVKSH